MKENAKINEDQIEMSGKGIKFSYRRFLSDSAIGLIIIGLIFICYYQNIPIMGVEFPQFNEVSKESKIFFIIILFFIATPTIAENRGGI